MRTRHEDGAAGKRKRVFLVDQFPVVRLALSEWINRTPDLMLCGTEASEAGGLAAVARLKPDVVVTEILNAQDLGFIQTLHQRYPRLPILVFSFRDEGWYALRALKAGADGYLMKGASIEGLIEGIRSTLEGRVVLSPEVRARLLSRCMHRRLARGHRCERGLVERSRI